MTRVSLWSNRYVRLGGVALLLFFIVILFLAPATGQKTSGSTYSRAPEGYLGWYGWMAAQGTPVQRWRRPLDDLLEPPSTDTSQTLLRVYPGMVDAYWAWDRDWLQQWLAAGNTAIALGLYAGLTEAPFTTLQNSPFGEVEIKTRRRKGLAMNSDRALLADAFGAVVWREPTDADGQLYIALTPHLAANAYRDAPGNYAFLADLVTQAGGPIWVDEYLHGFKDADVMAEETIRSWGEYLAQTPVKVAAIQIAIVLGIFLLAQNRRLGNLIPVPSPKVDNSRAYIDALAAVLHKADSTHFLVETIAKTERSHLAQTLGFHEAIVDDATLQAAWTEQTGQSSAQLKPLLQPPTISSTSTDTRLRAWLDQLQHIRQTPIR